MKRERLLRGLARAGALHVAAVGLLLVTAGVSRGDIILDEPSLAGYWMFDEPAGTSGPGSVQDSKGTNDGTPAGGVAFGQPSAMASLGTAVDFSGASGTKIDIPYSASLNPALFTVETWARVDASSTIHQSPLTARDASPVSGYMFYALPNNTD